MPRPDIPEPAPPDFLARLSKSAVRRLEPEVLLRDALQGGQTASPTVALMAMSDALSAARRQQRRIARAKKHWAKGVPSRAVSSVFDETHFYLISWVRAAKMARLVADATRFRRVGLALRRYARDIDAVTDARDHLEHLEERLVDGPVRRRLKQPHDIYNMAGDFMTFGGQRLDTGPRGFEVLRAFVGEVRNAVLYDSLDTLAATNHELLVRRLQNAARDVQTERMLRKMGIGPLVRKHR